MTERSRPESAVERRERQHRVASFVHEHYLAGSWASPEDDLRLASLSYELRHMTQAVIRNLEPELGADTTTLVGGFLARTQDADDAVRVLDASRTVNIAPLLKRAREYRAWCRQARAQLLRHPLSIDAYGESFARFVADVLRNHPGDDTLGLGPAIASASSTPGAVDLEPQLMLKVLQRAVRDRTRFRAAARAEPDAYPIAPLVMPGNLHDEDLRREYERHFARAIITEPLLRAIGSLGPIVEVLAGTGCCARLLRERGVDAIAFDPDPEDATAPGMHHVRRWGPVTQAPPSIAGEHGDRTLLIVAPPKAALVREALASYRGNSIAVVGDPLSDVLGACWSLDDTVPVTRWAGTRTALNVYGRTTTR